MNTPLTLPEIFAGETFLVFDRSDFSRKKANEKICELWSDSHNQEAFINLWLGANVANRFGFTVLQRDQKSRFGSRPPAWWKFCASEKRDAAIKEQDQLLRLGCLTRGELRHLGIRYI